MSRRQLIIPIFLPFGGCPHQCVFCDQEGITGRSSLPGVRDVAEKIELYLSTWKKGGRTEVAFYGGSFTGLPEDIQLKYLQAAFGYAASGRIDGVRVSTRPDYISVEKAGFLGSFRVDTVELGAQSMSDSVLAASGRGHRAEDTVLAVEVLKKAGFKTGLQFMPGLPGDTVSSITRTAEEIIRLSPDFVRVYPTVVLKNTPLHKMYIAGSYSPWGLEDMVSVCSDISALFKKAGIPIIRMGLQPTDELTENLVCGPYHPSFRQLVEGKMLQNCKI